MEIIELPYLFNIHVIWKNDRFYSRMKPENKLRKHFSVG
jgi:hypothetical protein